MDAAATLARLRALQASAIVQRSAMDDVEAFYKRVAQDGSAVPSLGPRIARLVSR